MHRGLKTGHRGLKTGRRDLKTGRRGLKTGHRGFTGVEQHCNNNDFTETMPGFTTTQEMEQMKQKCPKAARQPSLPNAKPGEANCPYRSGHVCLLIFQLTVTRD